MENSIKIVTHDGHFHADEVFAVATLLLFLNDKSVEIIRSRDLNVINSADYVVDVGGVHDIIANRFDHHQVGGGGTRENGIPYASFGLVWGHFGELLCGDLEVSTRIDRKLVQPIDAIDCGVSLMDSKIDNVIFYEICEFVEAFWPSWKESEEKINDTFDELVTIAKKLLTREIVKNKNKLEAKAIVEKFYIESSDKRLIVLDRSYPATEFLSKFSEPLFIVAPRDDGKWMIKAVRNDESSFKNRKDLPKSWAGMRDSEFEKISGVPGSVFCHTGRFMAVADSKEAILKLAEIALKD